MRLNKPCELEDFADPAAASLIRAMEGDLVEIYPDYPYGREHRKSWEGQQIVRGLSILGALEPQNGLLFANSGHERSVFQLTNHVRQVVAADIYGDPETGTCDPFLLDPGRFARQPYRARRLVPRNMDPRYLAFDDDSFEVVVLQRVTEHSLLEAERVLRAKGFAAFSIELAIDGGEAFEAAGVPVHDLASFRRLVSAAAGLVLVQDLQTTVSEATYATAIPLDEALEAARSGQARFPHLVMEHQGRRFTTATAFLRKSLQP